MPGKLQNKIAVVTGASSGLGRAIAVRYASEGARVVCADIVPTARAAVESEKQPTVELLQASHGQDAAVFVKCDVSSEEEVKNLVTKAVQWGGRLDIMVNNAGIAAEAANWDKAHRLHETDMSLFDKSIAINTRGVFLGCKYALQQFLAQDPHPPNERGDHTRGWIVNTASMLGLVGFARAPVYVTSKHAVVGMTKQIAIDYAADRIHCNCLCPGFVQTAMIKTNITVNAEAEAAIGALHPWGQLGTPNDVAKAAVFLASDDA